MKLHVKSTEGFQTGDTLYYYDVQRGDRAAIVSVRESHPNQVRPNRE